MKEGKYTKIFAQIQVSAIFHMRDIRRNYVPQIYTMYSLVWKCLVGAHHVQMGTDKEVRNQQKHMLLSFATKA